MIDFSAISSLERSLLHMRKYHQVPGCVSSAKSDFQNGRGQTDTKQSHYYPERDFTSEVSQSIEAKVNPSHNRLFS